MPEEIPKVEGILTAYFAKEEFTKETDETAGQHKYTFANNNTNIDKDKVAGIIKKRVDAQVKADKKYAKLEDIKTALTAVSYNKGESVTFNLCKLEANFKKISSAPLEEEVYVVAKTFLLDGKEVTIKIKEKEAVLVGPGSDLTVLEAKENGAEITTLKAIVEKGIAKVKIKLRPKGDDTLKTWKENLAGVKDGTHTYTFASDNINLTPEQKKKVAGIIAGKIKDALVGKKKFAKVEAIEKTLTKDAYNKDEQITFDVYKAVTEYLWLEAECQGDTKKYEGDFLKKDGEYFQIGKKCGCVIDEEFFFTNYEKEFPIKDKNNNIISLSENKKSSLRKMFLGISEYYTTEKRCCNLKIVAYMLATSKHETGDTYNPVEEANWLSWSARKKYFEEMYDPVLGKNEKRRNMATNNGNTEQGDGEKYFGRGYVQLTWKNNYKKMKDKFGVDFVNDTDKTLEHNWAMKILIYGSEEGVFTGLKLSNYIKSTTADYYNARRVINGTDAADTIKGYAEKIEKCLKIEKCECSSEVKKSGYDVNKAVEALNSNVQPASLSKCAKYVRLAIEAGGLSTSGRPISAKDYDTFLPTIGFTDIDTSNYVAQKGDISVIQSIDGHPHGHICMYNGSQWVSDFNQIDMWPAKSYRDNPPKYNIFRWQ